jgi:hypothetical protein
VKAKRGKRSACREIHCDESTEGPARVTMTRMELALCYRTQLRLILPLKASAKPAKGGRKNGPLVNLAGEKDRRQGSDQVLEVLSDRTNKAQRNDSKEKGTKGRKTVQNEAKKTVSKHVQGHTLTHRQTRGDTRWEWKSPPCGPPFICVHTPGPLFRCLHRGIFDSTLVDVFFSLLLVFFL